MFPTRKKSRFQFRPTGESLEDRSLMAWGASPPLHVNFSAPGNDRINIAVFDQNGGYSRTNAITHNEVDYRTFVAERSGPYTFQAQANGSRIDTVEALYSNNGTRLAYNDDANGSRDSNFTANLVAGRSYVIGVTNFTGSASGSYRITITPPSLYASASTPLGRVYSSGSATLTGTHLQLQLSGQTLNPLSYTDHQIQVRILDRQGNAIHTGSWIRGFRTAGEFIPGSPERDSETWNFDLSSFDLSHASRLSVRVSYF
jgi:hypothetical protein